MTEFITATVRLAGRKQGQEHAVELLGEPTVCPQLVVTPAVAVDLETGRLCFTGGVALTHIGTGRAVETDTRSHRLHQLAQMLTEQLPEFDWNFADIGHFYAHPAKREAACAVIREWHMADAPQGPINFMDDDETTKAARENDPAGTLLAEQLDWWIKHAESRMNGLDWDNPDHQRARMAEIGVSCQGYATIYLLAVLRAIDPKVAAIAARDLVAALDAGDVMGEWVWQWRQEHADGKPLSLRGIPAAELLSDFTV
ncbi:hypothetical protein BST43_15230 [Mycobacteroides saopaulense]|uniref:Uncharacterized protein n=1 Tax=Mycobacteroides saopaulense TaxID=1578165 RepID=A0A1X0J0Z4_9MYCO|nr:hypothetical protein [Mycobacteroides saopaulense]ORB55222.1 hypothetical protein BST43_15230 [Mycobacteroides saopaulense]